MTNEQLAALLSRYHYSIMTALEDVKSKLPPDLMVKVKPFFNLSNGDGCETYPVLDAVYEVMGEMQRDLESLQPVYEIKK